MKIVNKKKFIRSTSVTIGLIVFIILMLSNISYSHTESYKEICVSYGDTLWDIAKFEKYNNIYFEDKDIRDVVYEIKHINHLTNTDLTVGEKLSIPII